jgi:nicotinamide riboside transporter PnuC
MKARRYRLYLLWVAFDIVVIVLFAIVPLALVFRYGLK